jgi:uncharacterized damage-inducible protein DinB
MNAGTQLSKHLREVFLGGNWTAVNLKDELSDVSWQQAVTKVHNLNTIAKLVFHIHYYINPLLGVLKGGPLIGSDKFSFDVPVIDNSLAWNEMIEKVMEDALMLSSEIEKLDESRLFEEFAGPNYGNTYRNILGLIEHTHYHLGQIVLVKKILHVS